MSIIEARVTIRIKGAAFREYYPAERVTQLSLAIEKMLRICAEAALTERTALQPKLQMLANFPRRGSYVQEFVLAWEIADEMMKSLGPALVTLLPNMIPILQSGVELAKTLLSAYASGEPPSISVSENEGTVLINNQIHLHIDQFINNGTMAEPLIEVVRQLGNGFERVTVEDEDGKKISLDETDKAQLTDRRTKAAAKDLSQSIQRLRATRAPSAIEAPKHSDKPIEAIVDILSFDKIRRTGSLMVVSSEEISQRKFTFDLARRPETESAIMAMMRSRVRVVCHLIGKRKLELLQVDDASV